MPALRRLADGREHAEANFGTAGIKKQDGTPVADTDDPAVAADVAERLNDDEARREEDKWSA
jgi:hypothetical protein